MRSRFSTNREGIEFEYPPEVVKQQVRYWANHFAPCVADDNNWYRDESPMDGKDAQALGELFIVLDMMINKEDGDEESQNA